MGPLSAQVEGVLSFLGARYNPHFLRKRLSAYLCPLVGRILGIDFGLKRTGLAVTDPQQIIVQGLETVETLKLMEFLVAYSRRELIDEIVVGYPFTEGTWGDKAFKIKLDEFISDLKKQFPSIPVRLHDERYTSVHAREILRQSGLKKSKREDKKLLDKTSAVIILQEYLGHI